jgi:preprotein translocase subunit YajC
VDITLPFLLAQAAGGGGGGGMMTIGYVVVLLAIMYFLLIRPQQKQAREQRDLVQSLKKGDEVVTQSGIIGRIHTVAEREIVVEVASGVRMRFLKTAVQGKVPVTAAAPDGAPADKVEEKKEGK